VFRLSGETEMSECQRVLAAQSLTQSEQHVALGTAYTYIRKGACGDLQPGSPCLHSGSAGVHMIKQGTQETERRSESSGTCSEATTTLSLPFLDKYHQWKQKSQTCPGELHQHLFLQLRLMTECHSWIELEWGHQREVCSNLSVTPISKSAA
ncbi:ADP-L-glycero-D-manno-heptose-6-epimerase, partial [Dissostichus eleginoides]